MSEEPASSMISKVIEAELKLPRLMEPVGVSIEGKRAVVLLKCSRCLAVDLITWFPYSGDSEPIRFVCQLCKPKETP